MPVSPAPTLHERKQQVVRDAIWDAATALFEQKDFDAVTVDEVAEAAGVSRRTFFRYFSSKSDLLAQGIVSYADALTDAIEACPDGYAPAELFRHTVHQVAQQSAASPRTRKIMRIAAKYPTAREAQVARLSELQERVAEAFARRFEGEPEGRLLATVLAGLTLSVLGLTFRTWFDRTEQDISNSVEDVLATVGLLVCPATSR